MERCPSTLLWIATIGNVNSSAILAGTTVDCCCSLPILSQRCRQVGERGFGAEEPSRTEELEIYGGEPFNRVKVQVVHVAE
jgi:hypothetical protein